MMMFINIIEVITKSAPNQVDSRLNLFAEITIFCLLQADPPRIAARAEKIRFATSATVIASSSRAQHALRQS